MSLLDRIKDAFNDQQRWRKTVRRSEVREEDLLDAIAAARRSRKRHYDRIKTVGERFPDETEADQAQRRENLSDEIEDINAQIDLLLERLDDRKRKTARAYRELRESEERVKRLRDRRREIQAQRGNLTANFSRAEFDCRISPGCPDYMDGPLRDLCERVLEKMRARFGACHVNSGHRWGGPPAAYDYNASIGGETNSYHKYELRKSQPAADCTFERGTPAEWAAFARSLGVGGVGQYSSFVHVDTGPRRDWWG